MNSHRMTRREFLRSAGIGATFLFGQPLWLGRVSLSSNPSALSLDKEPIEPDAEISIIARDTTMQILPGAPTRVYTYEGKLLSGAGVTVDSIPGSYLGPILRAQSGKKIRIVFRNNLIEKSVIHPHGFRVPPECDGSPTQAISPGETKLYEFQVVDRAGPYWFHPHPMGRTAEQVLMGMAGLFHVWDPEEERAIPGASTGANDVPMVIQDRTFDRNNQILYQPNMMYGYLGNRILVNGKPDATFALEPRAYRLRLLNGSNARTYKLAWSNNMALRVIGTDGGLLSEPVSKNYVMLMPGERIDVWADFAALAGKSVTLRSLAFDPGGMGMMSGGMGGRGMMGGGMSGTGMMGSTMGIGAPFDILTVNVGTHATSTPVLGLPPALGMRYTVNNVPNYNSPRPFTLEMGHMMTWTINGRVYDMMAVADDEKVTRDEPIAWEWINNSPIPHPMHIHNVQFKVVQRTPPAYSASYGTISDGLVDSGWKDTVLVWPGERVKIAMTFTHYTGMYMYHCHILEHEDMTMMRNLMIVAPTMPTMPGM
ncbi:MAG: multicopper oxidase domain-containing protein [Chloroflexi bacterium]|nr:multicopper oxidase domain-containing protein [Chloroflexota bacterium]